MTGSRESLEKIVQTFKMISNIDCRVIDFKENPQSQIDHPFERLCQSEQISRNNCLDCANMIEFSCSQPEKWGGKYEWMCPVGVVFIFAVLKDTEQEKLGLCAGPFLMTDHDEFLSYDLAGLFNGIVPPKMIGAANALPYIESRKVPYFADTLYMLSSYAIERDSIEIRILEQISKNESEQFNQIEEIKTNDTEYRYPIESERMLHDYIVNGDKAAAQSVLNEILGNVFFASGGNFEIIKARTTELVVLLSRAAIEGGADVVRIFGMNYDYLNKISEFRTLDELNVWLSNVLIRFTNCVFNVSDLRHSDIIMSIIDYIRKNYMKKISLNDIAQNVNFSISYICRLFRDEMGLGISGFINKTRVDNAKIMLLDNDIPLVEISYLCGFEDQTYFNKVFKKITGVTPGKFREKRGKI